MENKRIKFNNIDAAIFLLKSGAPQLEQVLKWKGIQVHVLNLGKAFNDRLAAQLSDQVNRICVTRLISDSEKARISVRIRKLLLDEGITAKRTVLFADDPSLIRAAKKKSIFILAGIAGNSNGKRKFYEAGANIVVRDINNIDIFTGKADSAPHYSQDIPGLFDHVEHFSKQIKNKQPVFFFDYDGTLSPIVKDPEKAYMTEHRRDLLSELSEHHTVAVVSGRDRSAIQSFVDLDNIIYAGSHGFRISGPGGIHMEMEKAQELLPRLNKMEKQLTIMLEEMIEGVQIERKHYAIAIHYRNAPRGTYKTIVEMVNTVIGGDKDFKKGRGKKLLEIKPSMNWHKGKALEWIMDKLNFSWPDEYLPMYIGDDITDEDAFRTLADDGLGILVGSHSLLSAATYHLDSVDQVDQFLEELLYNHLLKN
ncbi:MAG: trehalose-phosphatase [Bacteroidales bacterium]|nr:trehalose-phosphatase [Bacteroidales bacterium]MDT8432584.1 trehalose-phosphatase [Bacteroidales bacterium]